MANDTMVRARFYTVPKVTDNSLLLEEVAKLAGGFTVTHGIGGWIDPEGQLVTEDQATLEVICDRVDAALVTILVNDAAKGAGEYAVLRTIEPVEYRMMAGLN